MSNKDLADSEPLALREEIDLMKELAEHRQRREAQHIAESQEPESQEQDPANQPPERLARALAWVAANDKDVARVRDAKVFYVYVHRDPMSGSVFYVGKGVDARAWNIFDRMPEHTERIYNYLKAGHAPGAWVSIIKWGLTEAEAIRAEDELIREYVRQDVDLLNRRRPLTEPPSEPSPLAVLAEKNQQHWQ